MQRNVHVAIPSYQLITVVLHSCSSYNLNVKFKPFHYVIKPVNLLNSNYHS
jgi:hypothetical protein